MGFFAAFDGPAWTTLGISVAALAISAWALWRGRTPQPHWEFVEAKEEQYGDPQWYDVHSNTYLKHVGKWVAKVRQSGPGSAEFALTSCRTPSGTWSEEREFQVPEIGRGARFDIFLCDDEKVPGEYVIRIRYRCLPNTRKLRTWEHTLTLD